MSAFVHLHTHSAYSLLEGTATPQALVDAAKRHKMPALALTDRNNLYGAIRFYTHAQKAGVKPVLGMEVDLDEWAGARSSGLVLLARNMDGYRNLCHLATVLRLNSDPEMFPPTGFDQEDEVLPWEPGVWGVPVFGFTSRTPTLPRPGKEPSLPADLLLSGRHARGLVALSGGRRGLVNRLAYEGKLKQAARVAGMLLSAFGEGNFFIEITAINERELEGISALADIANDLGIPIVAANDVLYLTPEDARTALALAVARKRAMMHHGKPTLSAGEDGCLSAPEDLVEEVGTERRFKPPEEMAALFHKYPQALGNTRFIAEQCNVELPLNKPQFPSIELPGETPYSRLWKLCFAGVTRRYRPLNEQVISRLKFELEVINNLGFCAYFLVVHDIVHFARSRGIPVLARGSAANSLAAYSLGITQVDPLAHDLLFERFLSPSRAEFELPDIDLDLCWRRRDEVLHYIYDRYGRDHVAIIGTHITFRLRSAWREMAKALGISPGRITNYELRITNYEEGDRDQGSGVSNEDSDEGNPKSGYPLGDQNPKLRDEVERTAFDLCKSIEGLPRHAGMHCAGVVITPGPIADLVPLQRAARDPSMAITQYDKDDIESLGLVKMDLLGSRALTTLVDTVQSAGLAAGASDIYKALEAIPFNDQRTYAMMAEANTLGCFQLESPGMRGLLKWMRPRSMNDVACAISLFRPGPLEGGFLESFMRRHLRQEPVTYHHPMMEAILKDTYGVILYQEQFLKLVHVLTGLSLGEAEKLRKDLGKARTVEERTRLGSWFVAGAIERGIDQLQAEKVWDTVAGYSGFGFCKAHACSYALTAYRSAYMKAHYPAHYLAAVINNQAGFYGPGVYVEDARRLRIELLPPHVNLSGALCETPARSRAIRFGLSFIKGLQERTISLILSERRNNGPFHSLLDLLARVPMTPPEITSLVKVGACDGLGADASIPFIAPVQGKLGESLGAVVGPVMNRSQMIWLLDSLLSTRRFATRRSGVDLSALTLQAAGSEMGAQMIMGSVWHQAGAPKVLGSVTFRLDVPTMEDYAPIEKLRFEQEVLGFALTHNEMELHAGTAVGKGAIPSGDLVRHANRQVSVAGTMAAGRRHTTKEGEQMLFLTLQDAEGLIETVFFPDAYHECAATLANGGYGPFLVRGTVQVSGKGRGIGVQPPSGLRLTDTVTLKTHPVLIAERVEMLDG
jgi:DNA-directed DNA polymerase III PolC